MRDNDCTLTWSPLEGQRKARALVPTQSSALSVTMVITERRGRYPLHPCLCPGHFKRSNWESPFFCLCPALLDSEREAIGPGQAAGFPGYHLLLGRARKRTRHCPRREAHCALEKHMVGSGASCLVSRTQLITSLAVNTREQGPGRGQVCGPRRPTQGCEVASRSEDPVASSRLLGIRGQRGRVEL